MGVNMVGLNPKSEAGEMFGLNWQGWRPINEHLLLMGIITDLEYVDDGAEMDDDRSVCAAKTIKQYMKENPDSGPVFLPHFAAFLEDCGGFETQ